MIQHIVDELKAQKIYNNTIIAVVGDNGPQYASGSFNPGYGQTLPLRGTKGSTFEGGIRTPGFMFGGYLDNYADGGLSGCEYDGLFYIADWYSSILGMADVANTNDNLDSINVWEDIKSVCLMNGATEHQRAEMVQMRLFPGSEYFYATAIRNGSYKLVINGTRSASNRRVTPSFGEWSDPIATTFYTPYDAGYDLLVPSNDSMIYSACYEEMSESKQNDSSNFAYSEFMLFDVDNDPIEACNLYDQMPEIADALFERLQNLSDGYEGGGIRTPAPPIGLSVATAAWNCNLNCYSPVNSSYVYDNESCYGLAVVKPWQEEEGYIELNVTKIYEAMIDRAEACDYVVNTTENIFEETLIATEENESGVGRLGVLVGLSVFTLLYIGG